MDWLNKITGDVKIATGWDIPIILAVLFTSITALIFYTRLTSGVDVSSSSAASRAPPSLPYWIPFFRHLPQWLFDYDGTLNETNKAFDTGISSLLLGRETHYIISSAQISGAVQTTYKSKLSDEACRKRIWQNVFGVSKKQSSLYDELVSAIHIPVKFHLDAEISSERLSVDDKILRRLQGNISDLITFNTSLIDQEPWEKISAVKISDDQKLAEVSLLPLVFLFLTHMTTDTLLSDTLLSDQDHQEVGPLLLAFVQSYSLLMTGLPRMMPHPTLPSAHITRRKLLGHLDKLLDATEDSELQNELLAARARMLDDHMAPRSIRVIELLRLLHGLNMPHVLAFWMLLHIISDVELLEHVRTETKHLIKASQDAPVMGFSVPPRVSIDASALLGPSAPVLQRCWLETARLYSRGQNSWVATEDFNLEGDDGGIFKGKEKWRVNKGDWIDVPYWLGNNDGVLWEEPEKWNPHRHITEEGKDMIFDTMVFDAPGLLGMDEGTRPARLFALAFVAIAIVLFDFETDIEKGIPKPQFSAGVALPDGDVRVRIRKRVLA